jgi:hypothetical protein
MMNDRPDIRTIYELQPVLPISEWWHWLLIVAVIGMLIGWIYWLYRRDTVKLSRSISWALTAMRFCVVAALVVYFLGPEKRTETRSVKDSRIAVLIDTSLSMGLSDDLDVGSRNANSIGPQTRMDQVTRWIKTQQPIQRLQRQHEVTVYRFDDQNRPEVVASFPKTGESKGDDASSVTTQQTVSKSKRLLATATKFGISGIVLAILGLVCILFSAFLSLRKSNGTHAMPLSIGMHAAVIALLLLAACDLWVPNFDLATSIGWNEADPNDLIVDSADVNLEEDPAAEVRAEDVDWNSRLAARGGATRLGAAIEFIVNRERSGPIAGIVAVTDGQSNTGTSPEAAMIAASNAGIPLYPIGIGSTRVARNVQVADVQAPPRVFPGDRFKVKSLITTFGLEGTSARVKLFSVDAKNTEFEIEEAEETVRLGADGEPLPVSFDVERAEKGKRRYTVRVLPIDRERETRDNQRSVVVSIVERKTNVLLIAGGPTREFRFLRNQLYRDKSITTHVWLQSAKSGADQESDVLLEQFPVTREEMYFFDCVIAFDPDWRELSPNQTALLERWVAEQAGGLILIAGPVNTPEWTRKPRGDEAIDVMRKLYPVSFYSQGSAIRKLGRFGGGEAFPLQFTREGRAAEYLWIGDTSSESLSSWDSFEGVFGYYAVNESKAGADVLANFADPNTLIGERLPIYFASQFYGAGRSFFQASGEMWRVRRMDVDYFEEYYNKLIRWASQGRLLRDSRRGVLLADRQRCWMGDTISLQAILRDAQDEPLMLSEIEATILRPDDTSDKVMLRSNAAAVRPGTYSGQFIAGVEGDFRVTLPIPNSPDLEVLSTTVTASIPDLEKERPQRNDALLSKLAEKSNGHYYVGVEEFSVAASEQTSPESQILSRDQESFLSGSFDRIFKRKLMMWLMGLLVLALAMEWTVRRLHRLA